MSALMADMAFPKGRTLPPGVTIIGGYIGGDAEHVWTIDEWSAFGKMRKLPIFVRSGAGNGFDDGIETLKLLYGLNVPGGAAVAYDKETDATDYVQVRQWTRVMWLGGYRPWVYGSLDYVEHYNRKYLWTADYTQRRHVNKGAVATQYAANLTYKDLAYDLSEVTRPRMVKVW